MNTPLDPAVYEMLGTIPGNPTTRIDQQRIISGGVKSQNLNAQYGVPTTGFLKIDYLNRRIVSNDGTTNRIVIGSPV